MTVLSYNIHGLPQAITGDDTPARLKQIGPKLNGFDLVGLQEDWLKDNWKHLDDAAKHPFRERFSDMKKTPEGTLPKVYGSGLTLYSKFKILKSAPVHFEKCQGLGDNASDCLASKGFQFVVLDVGGKELHWYNTHMEAGGSAKDDEARIEHGAKIVAAMKANSDGKALLFTGDTNLRKLNKKDGSENPVEKKLLEDFEALMTDSCAAAKCPEPTHIDRVFFRSGGGLQLTVDKWENLEPSFRDDKGVDLSDHPPIAVTFSVAP